MKFGKVNLLDKCNLKATTNQEVEKYFNQSIIQFQNIQFSYEIDSYF